MSQTFMDKNSFSAFFDSERALQPYSSLEAQLDDCVSLVDYYLYLGCGLRFDAETPVLMSGLPSKRQAPLEALRPAFRAFRHGQLDEEEKIPWRGRGSIWNPARKPRSRKQERP